MQDPLIGKFVIERDTFFRVIEKEHSFLVFLAFCVFAVGATYSHPQIGMWVGFGLAGYSTVANDSIQTLGTFISSNHQRKWWVLWFYIGGIFLVTVLYGWLTHNGDVSYGRLSARGFVNAPTSFSFLQLAAPIFLLVITRLRMPVSTTFLLLSCFSADAGSITAMLSKSLWGYTTAFTVAIIFWYILSRYAPFKFSSPAHPLWSVLQWISTGFLWSTWLMQDAANIAVYLPRSLSTIQFIGFAGFMFFGLGILFYMRGDRIQRVVEEKTEVTDVRSATVIDFVYGILLYLFKEISVIPMSTTWVFIGLLAGRELALNITRSDNLNLELKASLRLIRKDALYACIGLVISIAIALATNPQLLHG